jgi:MOSC domain-containing protein YiiM
MPQICSISVGKVKVINAEKENLQQEIHSAIHKLPLSTLRAPNPIKVHHLGIEGDEQANLKVHGGIEKAIYVYPKEHYAFWAERMVKQRMMDQGQELQHGNFGENLTTEGFVETEVFIGDIWQVDQTVLQVTQFREPCFKFNIKMNYSGAAKIMVQSGYCGWYLRVLEPGIMAAGQQIKVKAGPRKLSIANQSLDFYQRTGQPDLGI